MDLRQGDCLDLLPKLPSGSVGMVLTDLPYVNTKRHWDTPVALDRWWAEIRRVLRPRGAVLMFGQGAFAARLISSNPAWFRHDLVWRKNTVTGALNAKRAPLRAHEQVLVFGSGQTSYHPQMWEGQPSHSRRPGTRSTRFYADGIHDVAQEAGLTARYPRSVLDFQAVHVRQALIPSQKPVLLLEWLIRTYSEPDDLVLDPCAGVGSTLLAADACGRPSLGYELDADRVLLGLARSQPDLGDEEAS